MLIALFLTHEIITKFVSVFLNYLSAESPVSLIYIEELH
jgi:hypothetical protein